VVVTIDIGNTNITFGVFQRGGPEVPIHSANIQTDRATTTDELWIKFRSLMEWWGLGGRDLANPVVICSVVPSLDYEFVHMFEKYYHLTPRFVKNEDIPLAIEYDFPAEIGADRMVNAWAGVVQHPGENLVIVDFGTATTFDVVAAEGSYLGGLIMTGVMTSLRALEQKASKLPHIDLSLPTRTVAKNTVDGIRSGIINGNGAMVDELVRRICEEQKWEFCRTVATGGLSRLIKSSARRIDDLDPHLTLKGLFYLWKRFSGA
jgi:type III pantothenate kinase